MKWEMGRPYTTNDTNFTYMNNMNKGNVENGNFNKNKGNEQNGHDMPYKNATGKMEYRRKDTNGNDEDNIAKKGKENIGNDYKECSSSVNNKEKGK